MLVPIDENGVYVEGYDWLTGRDARQVADDVIADLRARGLLYRAHRFEHRYPHCWRCQEELVFRVDDEWFIRADEVRQPMLDAAATVHWVPEYAGARMADWLRNMGDWNISRRRYWGLPLPFYPCQACGHLTVIGSKAHLEERAISGLDQLRELHRPWIDRVVIRCEACEAPVHRIDAVGDAWLDAGIVPFSTLGYLEQSDEFQRWYPADFITEMREQIRLWFYSMLFMSVTLEDRAPYRTVFVYEKLNDETGRAMHKSWGNAIDFGEAAERMGADVMRWLYAGQNPLYNINFGYGPAGEVKRRMLTLWNVYAFFVTYARLDEFDPSQPPVPLAERADLDRWVLSRLQSLIDTMTEALDSFRVHRGVRAAQAFIEDVSNWYVRRGRRRYWKSEDDTDKQAAYQTLYEVLTTLVRVLAPVMPFWMEDIYQNLVRAVDPSAPASVHLTDWPQARDDRRDPRLDAAMADVQRVVRAGRAARNAANVKLRQPLRTALVQVPDDAAWDAVESLKPHVLDELNVKTLERMTSEHEHVDYQIQPNYRRLGPQFGPQVKQVAAALAALDAAEAVRELDERGELTVDLNGVVETLAPDDLNVRRTPREGFGVAEQDGVIVAVTTDIDDDLAREGLARELVHATQGLRRDAGLEVSDRIRLWVSADDTHQASATKMAEIATAMAEDLDQQVSTSDVASSLQALAKQPVMPDVAPVLEAFAKRQAEVFSDAAQALAKPIVMPDITPALEALAKRQAEVFSDAAQALAKPIVMPDIAPAIEAFARRQSEMFSATAQALAKPPVVPDIAPAIEAFAKRQSEMFSATAQALAKPIVMPDIAPALQALAKRQAAVATALDQKFADAARGVVDAIAAQEASIAGEVLALAVNKGDPPPDSAHAAPTLNGHPVQIRLARAQSATVRQSERSEESRSSTAAPGDEAS